MGKKKQIIKPMRGAIPPPRNLLAAATPYLPGNSEGSDLPPAPPGILLLVVAVFGFGG